MKQIRLKISLSVKKVQLKKLLKGKKITLRIHLQLKGVAESLVVESESTEINVGETQNVSEIEILSVLQSCEQKTINDQSENKTQVEDNSANSTNAEKAVTHKETVQPVIVGHVELESLTHTSAEDLQAKIIWDFKPSFLVVSIKKYPNLLKCFQEGNVTVREEWNQFQRLCRIRKKIVKSEQVLDLDRLVQTMPPETKVTVALEDNHEQKSQKNPVPPSSLSGSSSANEEDPYGWQTDVESTDGSQAETKGTCMYWKELY